ncbi:MAG: N-acetylmuramoyl-L-alanine amidase, partial [Methylobacteriaceae bacterium]|nr:N-acetylmuramoyl-L-alanine amidase [Methylobacteriaceae bacterium]
MERRSVAPEDFAPDSRCVSRVVPSPNHGDRVGGPVDAIVLHYTGMASGAAAIARLCDPAAEVSAHYVVERDGTILQLVPEARRAWHAGRAFWAGERDLNSSSIGVEIVNGGHDFGLPPYPARQIDAVIDLCADIVARRAVTPERLLAHSDIAPERKDDPGERFPWRRLAAAGLCRAVRPAPIRDGTELDGPAFAEARAALAAIGFDVAGAGGPDPALRAALRAFQRRHRPRRIDGRLDRSTLAPLRRYRA